MRVVFVLDSNNKVIFGITYEKVLSIINNKRIFQDGKFRSMPEAVVSLNINMKSYPKGSRQIDVKVTEKTQAVFDTYRTQDWILIEQDGKREFKNESL